MKKFLFGLIAILSMASAHADNERVTTRCGRPELVIQGVVSKRAVENVRRWDENKLIYEIRINGEAIDDVVVVTSDARYVLRSCWKV